MGKTQTVTRRGFLKVGAAAGCAAATLGVLGGCAGTTTGSEPAPEPAPEPELSETGDEKEAEAPAGGEAAAPMIYLIDRLVAKPGRGRAVYDRYLERFQAIAAEKGMALEHAIVAPPLWLTDPVSNNTLEFIWSFEGYGALAAAIAYGDPSVTAWWRELEEQLESRDRSYFSSEADVEVLNR